MGSDPEYLSGERVRLGRREPEPDHPRPVAGAVSWRPARWQLVAMVVVAVVVGTGWYVDHRIAVRESATVAACTGGLRSVSREYDVRMGAMYAYVRPSVGAAAPAQARMVDVLMAQPARQLLPSARAARARCQGIHVLAWHASILARRDAERAYASALVLRLDHLVTGRSAFRIDDARLDRLRSAAGIPAALGS